MASADVQKHITRAAATIESGACYEAQQTLKTVYHRFKAKKQNKESYELLQQGAIVQLSHRQITCGVELGLLLAEAFTTDRVPADQPSTSMMVAVIRAFPQPASTGPESEQGLDECSRLVSAAVKWAHKQSSGDAACAIHAAFAKYVWEAFGWQRMSKAVLHYVRSNDAPGFSEALSACSSTLRPEEQDLYVCRAVLQILAAAGKASTTRQLEFGRAVLQRCQASLPSLGASPLAHFTSMLIDAVQKRSDTLATLLKEKYMPSLSRDPALEALVCRVEVLYLDKGADALGGGGGLLGNLLRSLTALDDEDAEF